MTIPNEPIDCVAFMLVAGKRILVERRSETKQHLPGALAIPGGHVEVGEKLESALLRELHEELNVTPLSFFYLCTLIHHAEEYRRIHYFVVEGWSGEVSALEAESLRWLSLDDISALDLEIDVLAVESYLAL